MLALRQYFRNEILKAKRKVTTTSLKKRSSQNVVNKKNSSSGLIPSFANFSSPANVTMLERKSLDSGERQLYPQNFIKPASADLDDD
jgi:hypothetical protein